MAGLDVLFRAALLDQSLGQFRAFAIGDHPAGDVTAEDIQDHVEVEVGPFRRTEQLGDVPAPELIGSGRQQFRLLVGRMNQLVAALARLALLFQEAIHRANRAVIVALHRATSHKQRLASDPGSVLRADAPGLFPVPPGSVHVLAKAAQRSCGGKRPHDGRGSRKRATQTAHGKRRCVPTSVASSVTAAIRIRPPGPGSGIGCPNSAATFF